MRAHITLQRTQNYKRYHLVTLSVISCCLMLMIFCGCSIDFTLNFLTTNHFNSLSHSPCRFHRTFSISHFAVNSDKGSQMKFPKNCGFYFWLWFHLLANTHAHIARVIFICTDFRMWKKRSTNFRAKI